VFLLGATGYLGGAILVDLLEHFNEVRITALVRKKAHNDNKVSASEAVRNLGVEVVEGQFSDTELIVKHARTADITINAAGSDDVPLTNAILAGQKARVDEDKNRPAALFHTSGVAVFAGKQHSGRHDPNLKLWNDSNEEDISNINAEMLHGQVDELILRASKEGYTESYIMCPGAIVGPPSGPVPAVSTFFQFITKLALDHKKAFYIGEGSNVFYTVYLEDLIDLYRRVFKLILSHELAKESPYTRYYLGTSTPLAWKEIATSFGKALQKMGKIKHAEPQSINEVDLYNLTNSPEVKVYMSTSQKVQAERAKALGWNPRPVVFDSDDNWVENGVEAAIEAAKQQEKV